MNQQNNTTRMAQFRRTSNRIIRNIARIFRAILIYALICVVMSYIAQKYWPELTSEVAPNFYFFSKVCLEIVEWVYKIVMELLKPLLSLVGLA